MNRSNGVWEVLELETFVSKLLDLDRQAKQLLDDARTRAAWADEEAERAMHNLLEEFTRKEWAHLNAVRGSEEKLNEQANAEISVLKKQLRDEMENHFSQYSQGWKDEIFRRCVEGESR